MRVQKTTWKGKQHAPTGVWLPRRLTRWALLGFTSALMLLSVSALEYKPPVRLSTLSGGTQGTSSDIAAEPEGAGGVGLVGEAMQIGGEDAPLLCEREEPLDVLFVGNSYTHYFEMPELLRGMAESSGCKLNVEMVAPGGTNLDAHSRSGQTLSAIASADWDAVVLQNFSTLPSLPVPELREKTFPSVGALVSAIKQNNPSTSIYYYVTWGRRDGDRVRCQKNPMVCSFEGHTEALQRGYSLYQEEFGGALVNVGGAFLRAKHDKTSPVKHRDLYDRDGSHPSLMGSYLAASVFFATLYNSSPEGLSYPRGLSETTAKYLQSIAARTRISGA